MNTRDPFNLHRTSAFDIIRGRARLATAEITQKAREIGAQAIVAGTQAYESSKNTLEDMSFAIPKNVPSFNEPQRQLENQVWGSSGITSRSGSVHTGNGVMSGMSDRVGNFFEKNGDLPMYKDKPYTYASSRRRKPLWRQKRTLGIGTIFVVFALWFLGFFGGDSENNTRSKESWSWVQRQDKEGTKVDWLGRRERVVEAFTLSWDAYSRYAWGKRALPE
jgi:hypothetical protein